MNAREISVMNVPEIPGLFDDYRQNNIFQRSVGEALTRCVNSFKEKKIAETLGLAGIALTALTIIALQLRQLIA